MLEIKKKQGLDSKE